MMKKLLISGSFFYVKCEKSGSKNKGLSFRIHNGIEGPLYSYLISSDPSGSEPIISLFYFMILIV